MRQSLDRPVRASFEQSRDFTSAALLTRMESSYSQASAEQRRNSSVGPPGGAERSRSRTPDPMGQRGRRYIQPGQAL